MSPSCITWPERVAVWSTPMTSLLVSSLKVASLSCVRFAPRISGERAIDHSVSSVCCSAAVKRVSRGWPQPGTGPKWPSGSMSASGQWPGLVYGAHAATLANWPVKLCGKALPGSLVHTSQKSSEMRHMLASCATSSALSSAVGPGDRDSTIGRPAWSIAFRIMRISSAL